MPEILTSEQGYVTYLVKVILWRDFCGRAVRRGSAAARWLVLSIQIRLESWMDVDCSEESYEM
jgi:hypothetical protein